MFVLFLKEGHLSCDQQHPCEVTLVMVGIKSICPLVGWFGGMAVNPFFPEDSSLPKEGGLVNDIAFTSLGRLWIGQAEWALSGDNALICASVVPMSAEGV